MRLWRAITLTLSLPGRAQARLHLPDHPRPPPPLLLRLPEQLLLLLRGLLELLALGLQRLLAPAAVQLHLHLQLLQLLLHPLAVRVLVERVLARLQVEALLLSGVGHQLHPPLLRRQPARPHDPLRRPPQLLQLEVAPEHQFVALVDGDAFLLDGLAEEALEAGEEGEGEEARGGVGGGEGRGQGGVGVDRVDILHLNYNYAEQSVRQNGRQRRCSCSCSYSRSAARSRSPNRPSSLASRSSSTTCTHTFEKADISSAFTLPTTRCTSSRSAHLPAISSLREQACILMLSSSPSRPCPSSSPSACARREWEQGRWCWEGGEVERRRCGRGWREMEEGRVEGGACSHWLRLVIRLLSSPPLIIINTIMLAVISFSQDKPLLHCLCGFGAGRCAGQDNFWWQPINAGVIANPILQLFTQAMDNIGHQAYAICCILPFLAFMLLLHQMHSSSRLAQKLAAPRFPHSPSHAIITITSQMQEDTINTHHRQLPSPYPHPQQPHHQHSQPSPCGKYSFERVFEGQGRQLGQCSAGLARIHLINKKYLGEKACEAGREGRERKRARRGRKEWLECTSLPPIIEGLQY